MMPKIFSYTFTLLKPYLKPYVTHVLTHIFTLIVSFHLNLIFCAGLNYLIGIDDERVDFVISVGTNCILSERYEKMFEIGNNYLNVDRVSQYLIDNANETLFKIVKWSIILTTLLYTWMALFLIKFNNRVLALYTIQYIVSSVIYETLIRKDGDYYLLIKAYRWYYDRPVIVKVEFVDKKINELLGSNIYSNPVLPRSNSSHGLIQTDGYMISEDYLED